MQDDRLRLIFTCWHPALSTEARNAVHADADTFGATDLRQIVALYDQLLAMTPTPVVAMNRAIALGEVRGPAAALRHHRMVGMHDQTA